MTKNTHLVRRFIENATNDMLSSMGSDKKKLDSKGLSIDVLNAVVSKRE